MLFDICYQFCTAKNLIFRINFYIRIWLSVWLFSTFWTLPFLLQITFISFLPLLYKSMNLSECYRLWRALGIWLLAILLSPILTSTFLLLVNSSYLFPLIFSLSLSLWLFLPVDNCFINNLVIFTSMLYGWRSHEATVRERLIHTDRRPNLKTLKHQRTPDCNET